MIALLEARRAGLFARSQLWPNVVAGIVVGIVALPLAMAFAIASGAKPEQGLYTAIVAGLATTAFGGTRVQISGPTGAFVAVLAGVTAEFGIAGLQVATLMAGAILLIMGLVRLGGVIKFIPHPVIAGFTSGIAVIIWVGQWKDFFGLQPGPAGQHFHQKVWTLLQSFPGFDRNTTLVGLLTLAALIIAHRWFGRVRWLRRVPGPLFALLLAMGFQATVQLEGVATIGTAFGGIPRALPALAWPDLTLSQVMLLVGPAFAIALLGAIESLLTAVVADGMTGTRHDSNQELLGQGIANLLAPLFGGFAATGAVARTATSIRNGATSPVAGMVHCLFLVLVIVALAPYASAVPLASLAAILFVVAWNMSDVPHFLRVVRSAPAADRLLLLLTFGLTVFVDLVVAVNAGVILAALLFMRRMAETVSVREQVMTSDEAVRDPADAPVSLPPDVLVYRIEGPFFFGAAEKLERTLERVALDVRTVVIRLGQVPFMDATGMQTLAEIIGRFRKRHVRVMFCGIHPQIENDLAEAGLLRLLGPENVCSNLQQVAQRLAPPPAA
jgi:SulP family sulfate permease